MIPKEYYILFSMRKYFQMKNNLLKALYMLNESFLFNKRSDVTCSDMSHFKHFSYPDSD